MGAADYVNKHENLNRNEDTLMFEECMTSMLSVPYYQDGQTDASSKGKVSIGHSIPWYHS